MHTHPPVLNPADYMFLKIAAFSWPPLYILVYLCKQCTRLLCWSFRLFFSTNWPQIPLKNGGSLRIVSFIFSPSTLPSPLCQADALNIFRIKVHIMTNMHSVSLSLPHRLYHIGSSRLHVYFSTCQTTNLVNDRAFSLSDDSTLFLTPRPILPVWSETTNSYAFQGLPFLLMGHV